MASADNPTPEPMNYAPASDDNWLTLSFLAFFASLSLYGALGRHFFFDENSQFVRFILFIFFLITAFAFVMRWLYRNVKTRLFIEDGTLFLFGSAGNDAILLREIDHVTCGVEDCINITQKNGQTVSIPDEYIDSKKKDAFLTALAAAVRVANDQQGSSTNTTPS